MKSSSSKTALPIIILHGWGLSGGKYADLVEELKQRGFRTYALDLPGFGNEPLGEIRFLDDYIVFVKAFLQKEKIQQCILIGHSFGGRIAVKFSYKYPKQVSSLILTGVPIIRHRGIKQKIAEAVAGAGGKIMELFPKQAYEFSRKALYYALGEWDYYKAGHLKEVFKNIIAEDLVQYFKDIKIPIFLVWGKDDTFTPASDVRMLQFMRANTKAVIVDNTGHRLPYLHPKQFAAVVERCIS